MDAIRQRLIVQQRRSNTTGLDHIQDPIKDVVSRWGRKQSVEIHPVMPHHRARNRNRTETIDSNIGGFGGAS